MKELIPVLSPIPPQRGKGEVDVLNRKEKLQSFYLVLTEMVFYMDKKWSYCGLPRWIIYPTGFTS